ncbi:MAG: cytochrome c oxidase assembly protein [Parvularculaceae bacterium]|nr:cytochrome c oxidase assembly protein [Parvularculaceae bacterium]
MLTIRLSPNQKTATIAACAAIGMVGMAYAAVPLYRLFCQVTGFGGTTQRAEESASVVLDRTMTVRFDGVVDPHLPWTFKPEQLSQNLKVGQTQLAFYEAQNTTDHPVKGRATFNVTPDKAGIYFKKIHCFCFEEQVLQPGEKVSMPVTYFIDPKIADDPNLDDVETVTLSYTFFPWED